MEILDVSKKEDHRPESLLEYVQQHRGLLWEKIKQFNDKLQTVNGAVVANSEGMKEHFPLKHHIKNGMYTREIFMPKGSLVVSFIHKQDHPSFFMKGEMSVVLDTGEVKRIQAPMVVQTDIGTQRVAYMHEDVSWVCVYKTDKDTVEEAEKEVYTLDFKELPMSVIKTKKLLCQE